MSGATAAKHLREKGHRVTVFDKGRGPGGRASTRRADDLRFDHGVPFFTARGVPFVQQVAAWSHAGVAQRWVGRFAEIDGRDVTPLPDRNIWVGIPRMSRVVLHQLEGIETRFGRAVTSLERRDGSWWVVTEDGAESGPFERAVVAMPAPQAAALLGPVAQDLAHEAFGVRFAVCWSVMAAFGESIALPFDGVTLYTGSALSWIARESGKPERRPGLPERWVLHGCAEWSAAHAELAPEEAAAQLLEAFGEVCGLLGRTRPDPVFSCAHRWRYARCVEPLGRECLHDAGLGLAVCGDWCLGASMEDAWRSGFAAAEAIAETTPA